MLWILALVYWSVFSGLLYAEYAGLFEVDFSNGNKYHIFISAIVIICWPLWLGAALASAAYFYKKDKELEEDV